MDLNEVEKGMVWILHLIDAAARYADVCLIRRKKKRGSSVLHISDMGCLI